MKKISSDLSMLPSQCLVISIRRQVIAGLLSQQKCVLRRKQLSHKNFFLSAVCHC